MILGYWCGLWFVKFIKGKILPLSSSELRQQEVQLTQSINSCLALEHLLFSLDLYNIAHDCLIDVIMEHSNKRVRHRLWTRKEKEIAIVTHRGFLFHTLTAFGNECHPVVKKEICKQ